MKTDRELLELAAKAIGLGGCTIKVGRKNWNPLSDDGDALRLAVKLNLLVPECIEDWEWCRDKTEHTEVCANYRRAIVRAAASIGEQQCHI